MAHPEKLGKYPITAVLGEGAMGVVYKAYDPQLDRSVALKLLRRGRSSVTADLRLLREAKTLAQLRHPNVVAVYDAGLTNHGVFIAMDVGMIALAITLVMTLREWRGGLLQVLGYVFLGATVTFFAADVAYAAYLAGEQESTMLLDVSTIGWTMAMAFYAAGLIVYARLVDVLVVGE